MIYSSPSRRNYSALQSALFELAKVTLTQRFTNATLRAERTNLGAASVLDFRTAPHDRHDPELRSPLSPISLRYILMTRGRLPCDSARYDIRLPLTPAPWLF